MTLKLRSHGVSDQGRIRQNNEDRIWLDQDAGCFLVVDGVGGQAAGEIAAGMAVEAIQKRINHKSGSSEDRVRIAIAEANRAIYQAAAEREEWQGMACVLSLVVFDEENFTIGHVGDTRVYLVRSDAIRKLTRDHSPVGEREDEGTISELEAMRHPRRNEVFRDVGSELKEVDDPHFIDIYQGVFPENGALLLCSDGLTDLVPAAELQNALLAYPNAPNKAVEQLIAMANQAGGKDNVSVVVVYGPKFGLEAAITETEATQASQATKAISTKSQKTSNTSWLLFLGMLLGLAVGWWQGSRMSRQPLQPEPKSNETLIDAEKHFTWIVGGTGSEHLQTITEALAKANNGDRILVLAGSYTERLLIDKDVSISAREIGKVFLLPPPQTNPADNDALVTVRNTHEALLFGLNFQVGAPEAETPTPPEPSSTQPSPKNLRPALGILIENATVTITNCQIIQPSRTGVRILGASEGFFQGNKIRGCPKYAVFVGIGARAHFQYNLLIDNARDSPHLIFAESGAFPSFKWNFLINNTSTKVQGLSQEDFKTDNPLVPVKGPLP